MTIVGYGGLLEPDDVTVRWIAETLRAVADGRLRVPIDSVVPLGDVNDALDRLTDRSLEGKVVLDLTA